MICFIILRQMNGPPVSSCCSSQSLKLKRVYPAMILDPLNGSDKKLLVEKFHISAKMWTYLVIICKSYSDFYNSR